MVGGWGAECSDGVRVCGGQSASCFIGGNQFVNPVSWSECVVVVECVFRDCGGPLVSCCIMALERCRRQVSLRGSIVKDGRQVAPEARCRFLGPPSVLVNLEVCPLSVETYERVRSRQMIQIIKCY